MRWSKYATWSLICLVLCIATYTFTKKKYSWVQEVMTPYNVPWEFNIVVVLSIVSYAFLNASFIFWLMQGRELNKIKVKGVDKK